MTHHRKKICPLFLSQTEEAATMDPQACWNAIKDHRATAQTQPLDDWDRRELAACLDSLARWITRGGVLPTP